jgi:hypothetical protein
MNKIETRILIWISLITSTVLGQYPGDSLVWEGVDDFYDYRTAEAVEKLSRARQEYPENPAAHLTWASATWLHSQANDPIEKTYEVLSRDLDTIIPVYRDLINKNSAVPEYKLFLGSAIGLKARVHLGRKEWIKTLIAAYRGFKTVKEVAKENPEIYDTQLPIGIVEYYAGMSSFLVKLAVALFGLETTKSAGIEKMELAAEQGEFSWIEARSLLGFLYLWVDPNPDRALYHSIILKDRYPNNFYFRILYLESLIKTRNREAALTEIDELETAFRDLNEIQKRRYEGYFLYEKALFELYWGDLDRCREYIQQCIADYDAELDAILGNSWLIMGYLKDLDGNRQGARKAYKNCIKLDNNTDAISLAKTYLKQAFTKADLKNIRGI